MVTLLHPDHMSTREFWRRAEPWNIVHNGLRRPRDPMHHRRSSATLPRLLRVPGMFVCILLSEMASFLHMPGQLASQQATRHMIS